MLKNFINYAKYYVQKRFPFSENLGETLNRTTQKRILTAMLATSFISLLAMTYRIATHKNQPQPSVSEQFKQAKDKAQRTTKIGFARTEGVTELYEKANAIMKKDSLTKADYLELKLIDSTMRSLIQTTK